MATHLVKLACELPDNADRSLSLWTCAELGRTIVRDGIVEHISPQSIQRILFSQKLKPWRVHFWLGAKTPRDEAFRQTVLEIQGLYTRELASHEQVWCFDEMTSIQPRPRSAPTRPPRPGMSMLLEHEYTRCGALNLLAAFNTRSGRVIGVCRRRKRQVELIELLGEMDRLTPPEVTLVHMVCDNVRMHKGKAVCAWLDAHPRFRMHFTPVHCSWMDQVEQWFSILQRKRLNIPNFPDLDVLGARLLAFIEEWNTMAHPFHWTANSFAKVLAKVDAALAA